MKDFRQPGKWNYEADIPSFRFVPPFKLASAPPETGFTLVGETGAPINAGLISAGLRMTADLYDMLSNNGGGLDSEAQIGKYFYPISLVTCLYISWPRALRACNTS